MTTCPLCHEAPLTCDGCKEVIEHDPFDTLNAIHAALDGQVWSPDTLDTIAKILRDAGYALADAEEEDGEQTDCGGCGESWNATESDAFDSASYCSRACEAGDGR